MRVYLLHLVPVNILRNIYFVILATAYWLATNITFYRANALNAERLRLLAENESKDLEIKLGKARNAYLRQQMNPHMLFNTLNFVYNDVYRSSADAAECVRLLSDILRYSLEAGESGNSVSLVEEVEQIQNLIAINRFRFGASAFLDIALEGHYPEQQILPLVLLTLTENVFKHGNLKNPESPAVISLKVTERGLLFFTNNLKKIRGIPSKRKSLGLENIRIRLSYYYGNRYSMDIQDTGERFETTLRIF